jgi:hypothetical protein
LTVNKEDRQPCLCLRCLVTIALQQKKTLTLEPLATAEEDVAAD